MKSSEGFIGGSRDGCRSRCVWGSFDVGCEEGFVASQKLVGCGVGLCVSSEEVGDQRRQRTAMEEFTPVISGQLWIMNANEQAIAVKKNK